MEKTQIKELRRGHGRLGIVGSSYDLRMEIAEKVRRENPEGMTVEYKGRRIELKCGKSKSGKSVWYVSDQLSSDIVREICPRDWKGIDHPELVCYQMMINPDMTVEVITNRRCGENCQWKTGQWIEIAESDITIM